MKNPGILFGISAILLAGCSASPKTEPNTATSVNGAVVVTESQMKEVSLEEVKSVPIQEEFSAVGEVSFDENNVVRIYPIVSGSVDKVHVSLGDYVQKGTLLATILSTDITTFQRDFNVAKADQEVAEKNMDRAQELYKSGMMSEKDFAEAKKDYTNAVSNFNEKKQILHLYGGSPDRLDALFRVMAPRSGFIVERNINEGTQIRTDNSTNIFTISDLKTVWIWANVHESDMAKVKEGDQVTVKTIAYPDKTYTGNIRKIGTMLDPASRVIRVRTELENENGELKPEMFATVMIRSKAKDEVLAIPLKSIVLENNKFFAMREKAPRTFEKVQVTIGKRFTDFAEVTTGLSAGDKVIVNGALYVLTAYNQKR